MRYIQKNAEPQFFSAWKQNFYNMNRRQAVYDDLKSTNIYMLLKESLIREQGYICCYCEKRIGVEKYFMDCDIEHFMPRHPDRRYLTPSECEACKNAQMDYGNLMASCKGAWQDSLDHCNHKKDNWFNFRTCVSPTEKRIESLFGFSTEGKMFPIDGNESGRDMQEHINLNSDILKKQRRDAYITVLEQEFDEDELLDDRTYISDTIQEYREMRDGKYSEFSSMIVYCLENFFSREVL